MATSACDAQVHLWEVPSGRLLRTLPCGEKIVGKFAFSSDSQRLATVQVHGMIRIWDTASGRQLLELEDGGRRPLFDVRFHPDCKRIIATASDGSLLVFDASLPAAGNGNSSTGVATPEP